MQNMALNFINTFEITKLLRLRKYGIIFESMKITSKVIVRPIALWQPFCIYWICVSEIKSWTTDAPVSLQGHNQNYENKSLKMVTRPKYVGTSHWPHGKGMAKVITQINTQGDALGMKWPQVLSSEKATLGVWLILSQSYCYGYHGYDCKINLKLISIKHYLVHILAKFWVSIAYINSLRPRQNGRNFPDDIFKCIFMNENV